MSMSDPRLTALFNQEIPLVVVHDGPRGVPGAAGAPGVQGPPGDGVRVRGEWQAGATYVPGDAVTYPSAVDPNFQSLWLVVDGTAPAQGMTPHQQPGAWTEVGLTDARKQTGSYWRVYQLAHPFTKVGQPAAFYPSTGKYELADARVLERVGLGLIREVLGPDEFLIQTSGVVPDIDPSVLANVPPPGIPSWSPGTIYYVSSVPGRLQDYPATAAGGFSMPILVPTENDPVTGVQNGVILGWGPDGGAAAGGQAPLSPTQGQMWYRRDAFPGLYVWLTFPSGSYWVQAN